MKRHRDSRSGSAMIPTKPLWRPKEIINHTTIYFLKSRTKQPVIHGKDGQINHHTQPNYVKSAPFIGTKDEHIYPYT